MISAESRSWRAVTKSTFVVRELLVSADLLRDLEPVHARHHDVEKHELRLLVADVDEGRDAVVDHVDVEAAFGLLEVAPEGLRDLDVVLDDQHEGTRVEALGHRDAALDQEPGQHLRVDPTMSPWGPERRQVPAVDPVGYGPLAYADQPPDLVRRHQPCARSWVPRLRYPLREGSPGGSS